MGRRRHLFEPRVAAPRAAAADAAPRVRDRRYRDWPMPPAWTALLRPVPPPTHAGAWDEASDLPEEVERVLGVVRPRDRELLVRRVRGESLREIGVALRVHPGRARQLETRALRAASANASVAYELEARWNPASGEPFRMIRASKSEAAALKMAVYLLKVMLGRDLLLAARGRGEWLLFAAETFLGATLALRNMDMGDTVLKSADFAAKLGVPEKDLGHLPVLFPGKVQFLPGGWVAALHMKRTPGDFVGAARILAAAGFREWHPTQLEKAVSLLRGSLPSRALRASVHLRTAKKSGYFEIAGQMGKWRLVEGGDGFPDNLAAITGALEAAPCPLDVSELKASLGREVNIQNLRSRLSAAPERFLKFAPGVWGLVEKKYSRDTPLAKWLVRQLRAVKTIGKAALLERAGLCGFPTGLVLGTAALLPGVEISVRGVRWGAPRRRAPS